MQSPNAHFEDLTPNQLVTMELVMLRGGRVRYDVLASDFERWGAQYGLPSDEAIEQWHRDAEWELTFARHVYDQQFAAAAAE